MGRRRVLCNRMLNLLFIRNLNRPHVINEFRYLSSRFSSASFCGTSVALSLYSGGPTTEALVESSSVDPNLGFWGGEERESCRSGDSSLKDLLLSVSDVVPDISRRFRRFPRLKPENVLELLLGFESESQKAGIGGRKVGALWEIFRWVGGQYDGFKHLRQSCEIMASMLLREGMVKEVELLLMDIESRGDTLDNPEIFSNLIEKYVGGFDSEKAALLFDWMRDRNLVPSISCYQTLIDHFVQVQKTESAYRVCLDWVELAAESNNMKTHGISKVIESLSLDGKVQEARSLVRKLVALGCELSGSVLNKITFGYCEKQDFEDLLSFVAEMKYAPDVFVGNRIIHVLCRKFGAERANAFMEELEHLGFKPDEVTLGILIGWSCYELNIRRAILYLSDIVSKGLKPNVFSYNAILGGLFRQGLWEHAHHILDNMTDNGIVPNMLTFKILLAGYCRARRFKEAKMMIHEMSRYGLVEASAVEDPLSQAFILLGFDPLAVRLKRDNDAGLSKTEFFDDLGNGLYLDANLDNYEEKVNMVLDNSALPDFSSLVMRACDHGNLRTALELVDEMVRWGQELSCRGFTVLMKGLCSRAHVGKSAAFFGKWPKLANQLDGETLNILVQEYCKKGLTRQGRRVFHRMVQMDLRIHNKTYTLLINGFCKKGTVHDLLNLWAIAHKDNWLPDSDDCGALWECLIRRGMLKEAFELFDNVLGSYPHSWSETYKIFLEKLCVSGFSCIAHSFVKKLEERGYILDHDIYNHLIRGLCKDKNVSAAFSILGDMLGKKSVPCLDVSLMLIPQLCRAHDTGQAIALADLSLKTHPLGPSSVYHALIEGLCSAGKITEAENQVRNMILDGFLPDSDIYNFMFQGYCQDNDLRKVQEMLGILVRKNISFSITSYRKYAQRMCLEGQFFYAINLKSVLLLRENNPHSLVIYNLLIFYLLRAKSRFLVNKVLDELQAKGLSPDEVTYNFLVHGFSSCRDFSSSLHHLYSMISNGFRPNNRSLRIVISSLCDTGEINKALDLSRVMESRGWTHGSVVQTKLSGALISSGKIEEAGDFLTRATTQKGLTPDTINYDNLIKKVCAFGRLDIAVDLLNTMLKKGSIPSSLSYDSVIHGFLKYNRLDRAMDFKTEMLDLGLNPSISSWSILILKFCEAGQAGEAERIIKSMVRLDETPTREMYNAIIDRYHVENNTGKASEIIQLMQQSGFEPDFETHWSLIRNMSTSKEKVTSSNSQGFLSSLLSGNVFSGKK